MTFALEWLPAILEGAGLKVAEVPGWRTRGRREMGQIRGVICHHTATIAAGNMPTLEILVSGRSDLPGPLCHLGLGRDGTFYVVAAGLANHAGKGGWQGLIDRGNTNFIGIEAENGGRPEDIWPDAQMEAYRHGVAAILGKIGAASEMCCGHKEYAPGRKIDPSFDMAEFRRAVQTLTTDGRSLPLIAGTDEKGRPTLRRGDRGPDVETLQRLIGVDPDGAFGGATEAALRRSQEMLQLVPDGICGPRSWLLLSGEAPRPPVAPSPPAAPAAQASTRLRIGAGGLNIIRYFEHCEELQPDGRYKAYPDPGSRDGLPWTIGWGSTGEGIDQNTIWSLQQCDERLAVDIEKYSDEVLAAIGEALTTQNQFDAMVSFHYNTGRIRTATLTARHIARDYEGARDAFLWWVKNDGIVMQGLVRRRKMEADLYDTL